METFIGLGQLLVGALVVIIGLCGAWLRDRSKLHNEITDLKLSVVRLEEQLKQQTTLITTLISSLGGQHVQQQAAPG